MGRGCVMRTRKQVVKPSEGASGAHCAQQRENILKWQKQEAMLVVTAAP